MPPMPFSSPAYQFCTVEDLMLALSSATSSPSAGGGAPRHSGENPVDRDAGKLRLFVHRHAEFLERAQQLGIDLVHAGEVFLRLLRRVIADRLEIDLAIFHVGP